MKKLILLCCSIFLVSCTTVKNQYHTVQNRYKKMDHDRDYLHPENYMAERVHVPKGLSDDALKDMYKVPTIASKSSQTVPSIKPPTTESING